MIKRELEKAFLERASDRKALLLMGPRQSGKSTFLRTISKALPQPVLWWNGDEADIREQLENPTSTKLKAMIGSHKTVIIDEAQRVRNIGISLKLIVDNLPGVKLIATGSSSFELANKINEPMTGRKWEFNMFPFSFAELVAHSSLQEEKRLLNMRLVYGSYPEIVTEPGNERELLRELTNSYLYKDILTWERIQKPDKLEKLVQALAYQLAQVISYQELAQLCGLNNETVQRYIDLLEKAFVVYRLPAYSKNLRNELKKSYKIYFYDNGLRNAVINRFDPVNMRNDIGHLWENWFVTERMKSHKNKKEHVSMFFWRTLAQQEVDLIEDDGGKITAFECKWNPKMRGQVSRSFINAYPEADTHVVSVENAEQWLL